MILLLKLIGISFICVMGLKIVMSEGMLLEKLGKFFEKKIDEGNKIYDLFYCQWCMGTLQSITAHFFAFGLGILPFEWNWQLLIRWPLVVMGTGFVSGIAWTIYQTINDIRERNQIQAKYYNNVEKLAYFDIMDRKEKYKHKRNNH